MDILTGAHWFTSRHKSFSDVKDYYSDLRSVEMMGMNNGCLYYRSGDDLFIYREEDDKVKICTACLDPMQRVWSMSPDGYVLDREHTRLDEIEPDIEMVSDDGRPVKVVQDDGYIKFHVQASNLVAVQKARVPDGLELEDLVQQLKGGE